GGRTTARPRRRRPTREGEGGPQAEPTGVDRATVARGGETVPGRPRRRPNGNGPVLFDDLGGGVSFDVRAPAARHGGPRQVRAGASARLRPAGRVRGARRLPVGTIRTGTPAACRGAAAA